MELFVALKMLVTVVCEVKQQKKNSDFGVWKIIHANVLTLVYYGHIMILNYVKKLFL